MFQYKSAVANSIVGSSSRVPLPNASESPFSALSASSSICRVLPCLFLPRRKAIFLCYHAPQAFPMLLILFTTLSNPTRRRRYPLLPPTKPKHAPHSSHRSFKPQLPVCRPPIPVALKLFPNPMSTFKLQILRKISFLPAKCPIATYITSPI